VTWTATGGTISGTGFFVAGGTSGTFQVTATHAATGIIATKPLTVVSAPVGVGTPPELPRVLLNTTYVAPAGNVITVNAGGNLQSAVNSAACGDEIRLAPGAVFNGKLTLPARACTSNPIHIRTGGTLPPAGTRVDPLQAASFAKIVATNAEAAITAAPGAHGYRLIALEVKASSAVTLNYGLVRIGESNESSLSQLPGDVVLDRLYIHGHPTLQLSRCIALNGTSTAVIDSYVAECHGKGFDAQAIGGWTGPGPFKIVNNFLEGSGENVLFGGAPMRFGVGPADIEIRRNYLFKDPSWVTSKAWSIKNLFELKNARRVLFEQNVLENNWADAQLGFAILFQSLNDGAGANAAPATVQDVTVRYNRVIASNSGLNILAEVRYAGDGPTLPAARILVTQNIFEEMARSDRPGAGRMFQLLANMTDVTILNNTVLAAGPVNHAISLDGNLPAGLIANGTVIRNNLFPKSSYGLFGSSVGEGTPALNAYIRNWVFEKNVVIGRTAGSYPGNNFFPSSMPVPLPKGTDGLDVGANLAAVQQALAGVIP